MKKILVTKINTETAELFKQWLGFFWYKIYDRPEMISAYTEGYAILASQLYLNFLEKLNLLSIKEAPVFHRERWAALPIRDIDRNKTKGTSVKTDMDPPIVTGSQPIDSKYGAGKVFRVGGHVAPRGFISYPLPENWNNIATCIVNDIVTPSVILVKGKDFYVDNNTLYIKEDLDPIKHGFTTRQYSEGGVDITETLLWCCDVMVDLDYINNHFAYVIGLTLKSSEQAAKIVEALWETYVSGYPISLFLSGVAAILGVPCIKSDGETIEAILDNDDNLQIITDSNIYTYIKGSKLKPGVSYGAVLHKGFIPVDTVKLYSNMSPASKNLLEGSLASLMRDVKELQLSSAFFGCPLSSGFSLTWDSTPIYFEGVTSSGKPKYSFKLIGTDADNGIFWEHFWAAFEHSGVNGHELFKPYLYTANKEWNYDLSESTNTWVGIVRSVITFDNAPYKYGIELEEVKNTMLGGFITILGNTYKIEAIDTKYVYITAINNNKFATVPYRIRYKVVTNNLYTGGIAIGQIVGSISPLDFFLRNFIGANSAILIIDSMGVDIGSIVLLSNLQERLSKFGYLFTKVNIRLPGDMYDTEDVTDSVCTHEQYKTQNSLGSAEYMPGELWYKDSIVKIKYIAGCTNE